MELPGPPVKAAAAVPQQRTAAAAAVARSEERRVGKECRWRRMAGGTSKADGIRLAHDAVCLDHEGGRIGSRNIGREGGLFFEAEAGIRCLAVTGVQTCALPIWAL